MGLFGEKTTFGNNRSDMNRYQTAASPVGQAEQKYHEIHNEIENAYFELGRAYFEKNKDNEESDFSEQITYIKEKIKEETLWRQYYLSLVGKTLCEHCGAIITSDSAFCNKCGGKIEPRDFSAIGAGPDEHEAMQSLCPTCGSPLVEGAVFCEKCGNRV